MQRRPCAFWCASSCSGNHWTETGIWYFLSYRILFLHWKWCGTFYRLGCRTVGGFCKEHKVTAMIFKYNKIFANTYSVFGICLPYQSIVINTCIKVKKNYYILYYFFVKSNTIFISRSQDILVNIYKSSIQYIAAYCTTVWAVYTFHMFSYTIVLPRRKHSSNKNHCLLLTHQRTCPVHQSNCLYVKEK